MKTSVELLPIDLVEVVGKAVPEKFPVMFGVKMLPEEGRRKISA
jgi:hypothetical protein